MCIIVKNRYLLVTISIFFIFLFSSCNKVISHFSKYNFFNQKFFNIEAIERNDERFQILKDTIISQNSINNMLLSSKHDLQSIYYCENNDFNQPCYVSIVCEEDENGQKNVVITKNTLIRIKPNFSKKENGLNWEDNSEKELKIAYKIRTQRYTLKLNTENS